MSTSSSYKPTTFTLSNPPIPGDILFRDGERYAVTVVESTFWKIINLITNREIITHISLSTRYEGFTYTGPELIDCVRSANFYGTAPVNVATLDIDSTEMMYYLYLPVKMPGVNDFRSPRNLDPFQTLVDVCWQDYLELLKVTKGDITIREAVENKFVYLTVKTMFVGPGNPGNREGWHVDGFGSNGDINYIWANMNPTEFAIQEFVDVPIDDKGSMKAWEEQFNGNAYTFLNNTLLRLDESVVHRVSESVESGIRTFVKVTISDHEFRNEGNSHNYAFDYNWSMKPRQLDRNLDSDYSEVPSK